MEQMLNVELWAFSTGICLGIIIGLVAGWLIRGKTIW